MGGNCCKRAVTGVYEAAEVEDGGSVVFEWAQAVIGVNLDAGGTHGVVPVLASDVVVVVIVLVPCNRYHHTCSPPVNNH